MRELPWKSLVESLTDSDFHSPYIDRLRTRIEVAQGRPSLEREILQEIAQALGRAEDKVNVALLQLEVLEAQIQGESDPSRRRALTEAFNRHRDAAVQALHDLVIHREALGMYRHEQLAEIYPIPPRK
jgi:hypothetical protein